LAYQYFTLFGECDYGRGGSVSLLIEDYFRFASFHYGDHGVGGAQIYAYDFSHDF
jgi:hypothetical protein